MQANLQRKILEKLSLLPSREESAKDKCLCIYYLAASNGTVKRICLSIPTQHRGQIQSLWQLS